MNLGHQTADNRMNNERADFNTGPYEDPPLENKKNSKIGLRHVLSWPKIDLEPKFHEPGTFGGSV